LPALTEQLKKLRKDPPSVKELDRAKNLMQTAWLQGYETYHNQASTLGLFALDDHLDRLTQYLPKLLGLTRHHLAEVIEKYFHPLALATAAIENG
jgi:predicted Zn-dependent peptidase